jgi:hypothetical protein
MSRLPTAGEDQAPDLGSPIQARPGRTTPGPMQRSRSGLVLWTLSATLIVMTCWICMQNFVRSGPSKTTGIVNNLRQLDGAKREWARDHNPTGAVEVTREDIAPYLAVPPGKGWVKPVAGERYVLKSPAESPVAELTREVEGRPKGAILRLGTNTAAEIIPPTSKPIAARSASHDTQGD